MSLALLVVVMEMVALLLLSLLSLLLLLVVCRQNKAVIRGNEALKTGDLGPTDHI